MEDKEVMKEREFWDLVITVNGEEELNVEIPAEDIKKIVENAYEVSKDYIPWWDRED